MAKKVSEGATAAAAKPTAAPATNTPESEDQGGAGDPAGPAGDLSVDQQIKAGRAASAEQLDRIGDFLKAEQDKFRAAYPKLSAAIDAWQAKGGPRPTAVRVVSRVDGFRRANIAHSKEAVEHPVESFRLPEQLEALFAEPNLVVEFVGDVSAE
ncbi:HI1506-related protein [Mesorhizobium sp. 1M-11]|uniref:HI1506-related protein n=1 Tax=Mesorhizobium sp. 1M-11 TaxID=1529006 RepID=UPI0009ECA8AE|nr:HI1506-related protein [Mesorhizobium sp. 1M-11]